MKKQSTLFMVLMLLGISIFAQEVIVEWNFPDESADAIADGGIDQNPDKEISTIGGTSALDYKNAATTKAAQATGWNSGSELKCWVIGINTENYGTLALSSKLSSGGNDPGPRDFRLDYKIGESGEWIVIPNSAIVTANDWETGVLESLTLPENCSNQALLYLRWIMTNDTSSAGTLVEAGGKIKIDDIIITGTDISDIGKTQSEIFKVFPNPTTDFITIDNADQISIVRVVDINGKIVRSGTVARNQNFDLSTLQEGIYQLQFIGHKGEFKGISKIIKH